MQPYVSPFVLAQQRAAASRTKMNKLKRNKKSKTSSGKRVEWNSDFTKGDGYYWR